MPAMALIRKLFWFTLFAVFTFGFTVLFEHGTVNSQNCKIEMDALKKAINWKAPSKKD